MKKTLSILTALLCIFSNFGTKAYEITQMPDGGKKIVCKYDDLSWLTKQYENTIQNAKKSSEFKTKAAHIASDIAAPIGALGFVAGPCIAGYGCTAKPKIHKGAVASGIALAVAGISALIGAPIGAYNVSTAESKKLADLEIEKLVIETTKQQIDAYISGNLITASEAKRTFRYVIFIDKKGFVYKKEHMGALLSHEIIEFGKENNPLPVQKYKLDISEKNS